MMRDNLSFSPNIFQPNIFPWFFAQLSAKSVLMRVILNKKNGPSLISQQTRYRLRTFPSNQGECLESNHMSSWVWQFLTRKNNFPLHCHRRTFAEPLPRTHQPGSRLCTSLHILYTSRVLSETHLSINHLWLLLRPESLRNRPVVVLDGWTFIRRCFRKSFHTLSAELLKELYRVHVSWGNKSLFWFCRVDPENNSLIFVCFHNN